MSATWRFRGWAPQLGPSIRVGRRDGGFLAPFQACLLEPSRNSCALARAARRFRNEAHLFWRTGSGETPRALGHRLR